MIPVGPPPPRGGRSSARSGNVLGNGSFVGLREYLWHQSSQEMGPFTHILRPLRSLVICALLLLVPGCLTIEENYTFKKNGSGTMEYVVDLSALADVLGSLDKNDGKKRESPQGMQLGQQAELLKDLEGVKAVKLKQEDRGFIQRISFAFADIAALNRALNVLMPDSTGVQQEFFHWEGNTLVRKNNKHLSGIGEGIGGGGDSLNTQGILQSMKYTYSFKFRENVESTQLAAGMGKASPSKKKLELGTDFSVIAKDPSALDLRITLDR